MSSESNQHGRPACCPSFVLMELRVDELILERQEPLEQADRRNDDAGSSQL